MNHFTIRDQSINNLIILQIKNKLNKIMNSDSQATKTTGKMRLISKKETPTSSAKSTTSKATGKVRFNMNENSPSTSKSSARPVVPRTEKRTQKYNKKREFDIHIHRLMKAIRPDITISRDAIDVLNTFSMDIIDRISKAASDLVKYNKTSTLGMREIKSAAKLVLPQELATFAIVDANKAWKRYTDSKIVEAAANEDQMCVCTC